MTLTLKLKARQIGRKNALIPELTDLPEPLNRYSVHLGSDTVHQLPGGYVLQSQQRGRVFLPFADNDPRTAEVIAKVQRRLQR
jgi:hypothetical protein